MCNRNFFHSLKNSMKISSSVGILLHIRYCLESMNPRYYFCRIIIIIVIIIVIIAFIYCFCLPPPPLPYPRIFAHFSGAFARVCTPLTKLIQTHKREKHSLIDKFPPMAETENFPMKRWSHSYTLKCTYVDTLSVIQ